MDEVAEARVGDVVVDVDPHAGAFYGGQTGAGAVLHRGVEHDGDVELLRLGGRHGDDLATGEVAEFLQHAFLVPGGHVLAEMAEAEGHRDGAAEGVAIGADVAHHDEALLCAQHTGDLGEGAIWLRRRHRRRERGCRPRG